MGDWYTIGLALGVGTALGALFAGLLSSTPLGRAAAIVLAGVAGGVAGVVIEDWAEIAGGAHRAERRAVLDDPPLAAVVPDEVRDVVDVGPAARRE